MIVNKDSDQKFNHIMPINSDVNIDEHFMNIALNMAHQAADLNEVPVGAIVVDVEGNIVGRGFNQTISSNDPTAHAEILALRDAGNKIGNYRLIDCTMYVTLEPCCMCTMAAIHARIKTLVFGAYDEKTGACGSCFHLVDDDHHNHKIKVIGGVLQESCSQIISSFFARRRKEKKLLKKKTKSEQKDLV